MFIKINFVLLIWVFNIIIWFFLFVVYLIILIFRDGLNMIIVFLLCFEL